jgi:hypothetical protein
LTRDKFNLLILFGQAPIIAFLTFLVVGDKLPRDFPYFVMALVAIWFGTSVASREIIRERAVYTRERMVNLRLFPYVRIKTVRPGDHRVFAVPAAVRLFEVHALHRLLSVPGWAIPRSRSC